MRWADLDLLGHVNNVVYVDYLQEARVDLMRLHSDGRGHDPAEGVVVVRHEVTYTTPLEFRFRPISIECWVTQIGAASFTMAYEVFDEHDGARTTYLRAKTVLTPYVFATERPRRITAAERERLSTFFEAEPVERRTTPAPLDPATAGHYPVRVRFSDVDVYGHVNNVKYFEYFQEARIELLAQLWEGLPRTVNLVVAQTNVDYRLPILFRPEPYDLRSRISHVGNTSIVVESEILDGETLLSRARVVLVCWDQDHQRPAPPPAEHHARLLAAQPT
jgi:acyl-CoA thioester hydrolase